MHRYRVGSVPYVNAVPLIHAFQEHDDLTPVQVVFEVPSQLPALLDAQAVDAILVSSAYALTHPGLRAAREVGIASTGPVESVKVFSKVPWGQIQILATDLSSMTSNALAQIILAEDYGIRPRTVPMAPDLSTMLNHADAAVLIGDIGMMTEPPEGVEQMDLGQAWFGLTGLPFVWALWVGREGLTPELAGTLEASLMSSSLGWESTQSLLHFEQTPAQDLQEELNGFLGTAEVQAITELLGFEVLDTKALAQTIRSRRQEVLDAVAAEVAWPRDRLERYLTRTMSYQLDEPFHEALEVFAERLVRHGLTSATYPITWVQSDPEEDPDDRFAGIEE